MLHYHSVQWLIMEAHLLLSHFSATYSGILIARHYASGKGVL